MKKILIPPVVVFISLFMIVLFYFLFPGFNRILFPFNLAGILFIWGGIVIMGKSRDLFRKHNTTLGIKPSSALITEGVFSKTRNPMYIGMFLLLLGISVGFGNLLSMGTPFFFIMMMRLIFIPKEEKMMLEVFGDEYLHYKKQVRRWL